MSTSRTASVARTTRETDIAVELNLDGSGSATSDTDIPFFDHMLQQLGTHAGWDLDVRPDGTGLPEGHGSVAEGQAIYDANWSPLRRHPEAISRGNVFGLTTESSPVRLMLPPRYSGLRLRQP